MPSIGPNLSTFPRFRSKSAQARILDASKRLSSGVILWYQGGFLLPDLLRKSSVSTILNVESGVSHKDNGAKFEYFPFLPIKVPIFGCLSKIIMVWGVLKGIFISRSIVVLGHELRDFYMKNGDQLSASPASSISFPTTSLSQSCCPKSSVFVQRRTSSFGVETYDCLLIYI